MPAASSASGFDEEKHRSDALAEFKQVFAYWFIDAMAFKFKKDSLYAKQLAHLDDETEPTLVDDLWRLSTIPLNKMLSRKTKYGLLPLLALCQTGGHLAASFSERVNSAAKDKIGDQRRRLTDLEAEMEISLRANRPFMLLMKKHYPDVVKEHQDKLIARFGELEKDEADVVIITGNEEPSSASVHTSTAATAEFQPA